MESNRAMINRKKEMYIISRASGRFDLRSAILVTVCNLALVVPVIYFNDNIIIIVLCILSIITTAIADIAFLCKKHFLFFSLRGFSFCLSAYLALIVYAGFLEPSLTNRYTEIVFSSILLWGIFIIISVSVTIKKIQGGQYLKKRKKDDKLKYWMGSGGTGAAIALVFKSHLLILAIIIIALANLIIIMALKEATQDMIAHYYQKKFDNQ